ncbi:MAG: hypothetical protein AAF479_11560 [Pseudomonadota bacterium]
MLSSSRWTLLDSLACIALIALVLRIAGTDAPGDTASDWHDARDARVAAILPALSVAMPAATDWIASPGPRRLDGTLRCIGLAEIRARNACRQSDTRECRNAQADRRIAEMNLWPKRRDGQIAIAMHDRISLYARAYETLSTNGTEPMRTSSQLIRDRDGAMCRQYLHMTEARLHGSEIRQSRRTVQESAG